MYLKVCECVCLGRFLDLKERLLVLLCYHLDNIHTDSAQIPACITVRVCVRVRVRVRVRAGKPDMFTCTCFCVSIRLEDVGLCCLFVLVCV